MVGSAILHTQANRILAHVRRLELIKSVISYIIHTYLFSRILNLKGFGSWIETKLFIRKIKKIAPDIIHLHNIHQNFLNLPLLFLFLKKAGIPVIWTLHDCWAVTGGVLISCTINAKNWKTGCYRCPRCGNSDTGGELKRGVPYYAVGVKKERSIYNFCSESDFCYSLGVAVGRSEKFGCRFCTCTGYFQRSGQYSILSSYRYTSH